MRKLDIAEIAVTLAGAIVLVTALSAFSAAQPTSSDVLSAVTAAKVDVFESRMRRMEDNQDKMIWGLLGVLGTQFFQIMQHRRSRQFHEEE